MNIPQICKYPFDRNSDTPVTTGIPEPMPTPIPDNNTFKVNIIRDSSQSRTGSPGTYAPLQTHAPTRIPEHVRSGPRMYSVFDMHFAAQSRARTLNGFASIIGVCRACKRAIVSLPEQYTPISQYYTVCAVRGPASRTRTRVPHVKRHLGNCRWARERARARARITFLFGKRICITQSARGEG